MGIVSVDSQEGGGRSWVGLKSLVRRKQVDSAHSNSRPHQLAKELSVPYLIAIGKHFLSAFLFFIFLLVVVFNLFKVDFGLFLLLGLDCFVYLYSFPYAFSLKASCFI